MRIGELSRRTGVSERSLRYYEQQKLLEPQRRPSGYREYAESDVEVVRRIRTLLAAGLNTTIIAEVLPCMVVDGDLLVPGCSELAVELSRERDRITGQIDELSDARAILTEIITATAETDPSAVYDCDSIDEVTAGSRRRQPVPR
ncbi:putative transcriptional regulator [Actinoalloteichus sp. GBA129-24]|uniref:Transcriptional regulator n=2 Tax=Pseudonocardiaceae TaxID=2070 RepID=A0AAC9LEW3_9PSEU|nr:MULTISPECIES: MerR family transcriptional regulator [Actinoalloteichus]APU15040.1 putative transcriptional regulator [Actinoalloteichus fjordicus]APU21108.1 putative transcriptional regulator [Actinoalloteichus sp. GBA129-24]